MSDDFTPITEAEVVMPLIRLRSFARYYQEQRPRIEAARAVDGPPVLQFRIKPGMNGGGTNLGDIFEADDGRVSLAWIITLKERPHTLRQAHIVAHELHHCILDIEGWPRPRLANAAPPDMLRLAIGVGGLLDIPIAHALARYGFPNDAKRSLEAVAMHIGGKQHAPQLLRQLKSVDFTDRTAIAELMRNIAAPSGGLLRIDFRG